MLLFAIYERSRAHAHQYSYLPQETDRNKISVEIKNNALMNRNEQAG